MGVIGFAHMHVNELVDRFVATGRADIVACADTQPRTPSMTTVEGSRQPICSERLPLPAARAPTRTTEEMLRAERLDIAILCPENAGMPRSPKRSARHGVHIVTEKPMASRLHDALRMASAAEKAGVALAVNWPITWRRRYAG